jgi:shikimate dehydrogenase
VSERVTGAAGRVRLGVLGWPVAHSLSPAIQNAALLAAGLTGWRYQLLPLPPALFDETVRALGAAGLRGANVTIPHKPAALALSQTRSARALAIGAANTLLFEQDGTVAADNTDAPALTEALPFAMTGRTALVLGAGGTARAAVWALLAGGAERVSVLNRTARRAEALCAELGGTAVSRPVGADLLVNCTAVGLDAAGDAHLQMPIARELLPEFGFVVDYVYRQGGTRLIAEARSLGIGGVDGLELLVGQGALAFEQFTGLPAPLGAMRAAVGL